MLSSVDIIEGEKWGGRATNGGAVVDRMVRSGSLEDRWEKSIRQRSSQCSGPELGACLVFPVSIG